MTITTILLSFLLQAPAHATSATIVPGYPPAVMPVPVPGASPRQPAARPAAPRPYLLPVAPAREPRTRILPRPIPPAVPGMMPPMMLLSHNGPQPVPDILNGLFDGLKPTK